MLPHQKLLKTHFHTYLKESDFSLHLLLYSFYTFCQYILVIFYNFFSYIYYYYRVAHFDKICYNYFCRDTEQTLGISLVIVFSGNRKGVMPMMNTMEVLTLLLVIFAALSYLDNHRK